MTGKADPAAARPDLSTEKADPSAAWADPLSARADPAGRWTRAAAGLTRRGTAWQTHAARGKGRGLAHGALRTDRENKDWFKAWASEYPPGTPNGDALAGVDTESGTALPEILEIASVVQEGLSLRVSYVPGTGQHATVLDLQFLVETVNVAWQRVTADVAAGSNLIGPFVAGQIVHVRTDVGNSRDASELSPEQAVTIQPPP